MLLYNIPLYTKTIFNFKYPLFMNCNEAHSQELPPSSQQAN